MTYLKEIDKSIFLWINSHNCDWCDTFMFWVSDKWIWIPLYCFFLYLLIKSFKKGATIALILVGVMISLTDQLSVHLFKEIFERLRPCHEPSLIGLVHLVNGKCGGEFGFISSHAANTAALGSFLLLLLSKQFRFLIVLIPIWVLLVLYSRVYLGVHYPLDVLAGGLFGYVFGFLFSKVYFYLNHKLIINK